jgi:hypothetical protein
VNDVLTIASPDLIRMDQVLDESIVKAKYIPREVPGYLKDFPVNDPAFDATEVTSITTVNFLYFTFRIFYIPHYIFFSIIARTLLRSRKISFSSE